MAWQDSKPHVVIVGAGLAGLSAADRLSSENFRVTVLETQGRVGGRALSVGEGLAKGLVAEAGPSRYPPGLKRMFDFAKRFGLEVRSFYPVSGAVVGFLDGRRIEQYEANSEEFWGYTSLRRKYPGMLEGLLLRNASRARAFYRRIRGKIPWATYRIKGGTEKLAEALANACGAEISLNCRAQSIKQDGRRVTVEFASANSIESLHADFIICAVPLSMLLTIDFSPELSSEKRRIAEEVPFSSAIRIFLQMDRPYWRDQGYNGFAVTDTVGEVWDPHFDEARTPAMLVCYAKDELAVNLGRLSETERIAHAVAELENIFPGAAEHFQTGTSFYWNEQPWIRGGWPLARLRHAREMAQFRKPEGRVYFAGDYATPPLHLNNTEGAIESGQHAAGLICGEVATT
jgi:monoamine oxidase